MKLKLNVEDVDVQSFVIAEGVIRHGTVRGHASQVGQATCGQQTCGQDTCNGTCVDTECVGQCAGNSVGLSACCATVDCTANPNDFHCIDSVHYCFNTQAEDCTFYC